MKKLKKWQIVLIVILALGVIGVLAGGGDEEMPVFTFVFCCGRCLGCTRWGW